MNMTQAFWVLIVVAVLIKIIIEIKKSHGRIKK